MEECGPCPVFASFTLAFVLQLRKKHGKTSVRVRKISVRLKKSHSTVHTSCSFLLRMRNVSDKTCRGNENTHFVSCKSPPQNRAVYEMIWRNIVEPGRPQMTIWRMRISCWIPKATNTHTHTLRLCNTHCFSTTTMVVFKHLNVISTLPVLFYLVA